MFLRYIASEINVYKKNHIFVSYLMIEPGSSPKIVIYFVLFLILICDVILHFLGITL